MGSGGSKELDPNKMMELMEHKSQANSTQMMEFMTAMQTQNRSTMNMVCCLVPFYILFSENI